MKHTNHLLHFGITLLLSISIGVSIYGFILIDKVGNDVESSLTQFTYPDEVATEEKQEESEPVQLSQIFPKLPISHKSTTNKLACNKPSFKKEEKSPVENLKPSKDTTTTMTLQASNRKGSEFIGWYYQDKLLSQDMTLTLETNKINKVTACFFPKKYTITGIRKGHGSVLGSGIFYHGTSVTLSAIPAKGFDFDGWFKNGHKISSSQNYSLIADAHYSLEARFSDTRLQRICSKIYEQPKMFRSLGIDKKDLVLNVSKLFYNVSLFFIEIETTNYSKESMFLSPAFFSYKMRNLKGDTSIKTLTPIYIHNEPGELVSNSSQKTIYVFDICSVPTEKDIYIEQADICYKLKKRTINKVKDITI